MNQPSDIEITRQVEAAPISKIGENLGIPWETLKPYGHDKAKISLDYTHQVSQKPSGKLILVTAVTPTPAGEGKTTTSVGLHDALCRIGKQSLVCLREPSLGPCFGMKGGAAGGGYAQVIPMEDINLHFTGDFHAIGAAHNLLSALIDNHIYWGNKLGIDVRRLSWRRVVDINDRALRQINVGLGGVANGFPRESGYDITVASEIMAIFCLAENLKDLEQRLGNIIIGNGLDKQPILARDIGAAGPMTALLRDAFSPNLVQTLEGNPAIVHGGPFANIAHGCNSVIATKSALGMADYVVTEAGFGADLGAEKFFNIKCRKANLRPDVAVIVVTIRALKHQGGCARRELNKPDADAVQSGLDNLRRHMSNVGHFGVPVVVAINRFVEDSDEEVGVVQEFCNQFGINAVTCTHWSDGGAGAEELAYEVVRLADAGTAQFRPLYDDAMPLWEKTRMVARQIYSADDIIADKKVRARFNEFENNGYGNLPICMAKTQYSFSTDPNLLGAPSNHVVSVREVRLAAGAGFIVVVCGEIMTMPGLPKTPAANQIHVDENGLIQGLF